MLLPFARRVASLLRANFSSFQSWMPNTHTPPNSYVSYVSQKHEKSHNLRRDQISQNGSAHMLRDGGQLGKVKGAIVGIGKDANTGSNYPSEGSELAEYNQKKPAINYNEIKPYGGVVKHQPLPLLLRYKPQIVQSINQNNLPHCSAFNIIQFLLKERQLGEIDAFVSAFSLVEDFLTEKLNQTALIDLVRLKHALLGLRLHAEKLIKKINKRVHREYKSLDADGLLAVFTAERSQEYRDVQDNILVELLKQKHTRQFSKNPARLLEFIECYAYYRISKWKKRRDGKAQPESQIDGAKIISKLAVQQAIASFTNEEKLRLMDSFYRMGLSGIKHLLRKIVASTNQDQLSPKEAFEYIILLSRLQNGEGYLSTQQMQTIKPTLLTSWSTFNNHEKLKIIHLYWNSSHSWEQFKPLYEAVPVESDANILYYFAQIEITDSSNREHQIAKAMAELDYIPIPYFTKFKQWVVFVDPLSQNLLSLQKKVYETEVFISQDRVIQNLINDPDVIALGKFLTILPYKLRTFVPIKNFTIIQYAYENLSLGVEATHSREISPSGVLKRQVVARNRVLQSLGWRIIQLRWKYFSKLSINTQHQFLYSKLEEVLPQREDSKLKSNLIEEVELSSGRPTMLIDSEGSRGSLQGRRLTEDDMNKLMQGLSVERFMPKVPEKPSKQTDKKRR